MMLMMLKRLKDAYDVLRGYRSLDTEYNAGILVGQLYAQGLRPVRVDRMAPAPGPKKDVN